MNVIAIESLVKRYGTQRAVDDVTLAVPCGSVCGLLGPNGAGKSTTFKCLLGLARPTSGTIAVLGAPVAPATFERLSYVPERSALYGWLTARQHFDVAARLYARFDPARASALARRFDIDVSPEWYARERADAKVVPTYDYIAVEARGTITFFDDMRRTRIIVDELTTHHERERAVPWSIDDAPANFIDANLHGIVGFALTITELTGAWKLSRDEAPDDRASIADGMAASDDPRVRALADRVGAPKYHSSSRIR